MKIETAYPELVFVLLAVLAVLFSAYSYRFTIPKISPLKKYLLISIRSTALIVIISVFFEPKIFYSTEKEIPAKLKVVVDNSLSMKPNELKIENILNEIENNFNEDEIVLSTLKNENVLEDSIKYSLGLTNLSFPLSNSDASENIKSILLLSDGNVNDGASPLGIAEDSAIPIYTIGFGDTSNVKDVVLKNIKTNQTAFVNNSLPMKLFFNAKGFLGEKIKIIMTEDEKEIGSQVFVLSENNIAVFNYIPKNDGVKIINFKTIPLENEFSLKNNSVSTIVNVVNKKNEIIIISGAPSADVTALSQALSTNENILISQFYDLPSGEMKSSEENFNFNSKLQSANAIFLIGFPTVNTGSNFNKVINKINTEETPLFVMLSRETKHEKLKEIENNLPIIIGNESESEQEIFFVENTSNELIKTIDDNFWNGNPPVYTTNINFKLKPNAVFLGKIKIQNIELNSPIAAALNTQNKRTVAFLGYGFWKWRLTNDNSKKLNFDLFIRNITQWLLAKNNERLKVYPLKPEFTINEEVIFNAEACTESGNPTDEAEIDLLIYNGNNKITTPFTAKGNGIYEAKLNSLPAGNYKFTAEAKIGNNSFGRVNGKIFIGESSIEFIETKQNVKLLKQVASLSNGEYFENNNYKNIFERIKLSLKNQTEYKVEKTEYGIFNYKVLLIAIFLFAIEWYIRKQTGML